MMRRILLAVFAVLMSCVAVTAQEEDAVETRLPADESEIMFGVRLPKKNKLSKETGKMLENKVVQILGRCGAGASGKLDVFVVEPVVNVMAENSTEGLVRNVTAVEGELSLTARHRYTDAVFYNTTVPLNAAAKNGSDDDVVKLLVKSIKPTDAAYVRFVRNARKNVFAYGQTHPEIYEVPEQPDTVLLILPVLVTSPDSPKPIAENSDPDSDPESDSGEECEIYFSQPGWDAKVNSCVYEASTRCIVFDLSVKNTKRTQRNRVYTCIERAIAANGGKYEEFFSDDNYHDYPYDVPVNLQLYIKNVYSNPGKVPFVEIHIGDCNMELRNVIVKDKVK